MHRRVLVAVGVAAVSLTGGYAALAPAKETQAASRQATVRLKNFQFGMRLHFKAGKTKFTFRNTGSFPHNFTVVEALGGAKKFKSATVAPGKKQVKMVNLRPGAYVVVCTVFNGAHLAQGMYKQFTVGTFNRTTGKWGP